MMIKPTDRIDEVLARDPRLMTVLAQVSPTFARMGRDELPRPMARLVTVEQAARVAGLDPEELLARLNHALAHPDSAPLPLAPAAVEQAAGADADVIPEAVRKVPARLVVECDVREDLRSGREPFGRIMAAARSTPDGGVLKVRATFEPAPLYAVLGKQGFSHAAERVGADDWCVWFHRGGANQAVVHAGTSPADAPTSAAPDTEGVVVLDVRGLEPPEPMVRTLEALTALPRGGTLVQINVRVPQFLLPKLEEHGFTYEIREQAADLVRVFIRHQHT